MLLLATTQLIGQNNTSSASSLPPSAQADATTKGSKFLEMLEEEEVTKSLDSFNEHYTYTNPSSSRYDTLLYNTGKFRSDEVPRYSQSQVQQQLYDLPTVIPMDYNIYVQRYIDVYALRRRDQVSRMMGLSRVYFPIFEEELDRMGMPMELKYLSVVESALDPHARSYVGATGLWQFMLSTGRMYGLKVDSYVDERKDPIKATKAAMRYLSEAHKEFGDWLLAIASYNCGPGNVRKAIARSGGKRTFWEIREWLPRETRGYVPAFIAATYVFEHSHMLNLYPIHVDFSFHQDTLHIKRMDITLQEVATTTNTDVHILKNLNPELKLDRIPYSTRTYVLRVPPKTAQQYAMQQVSIKSKYGRKRNQYIAPLPTRHVGSNTVRNTPKTSADPPSGRKLVYYTVKPGDAVSTIAERYGVSSRQVASWNGLRRYKIRAGQRLKIYTTPAKAQTATTQRTASSQKSPKVAGPQAPSRGQYYTVKSGDTLWGIAKLYDGLSIDQINRLNPGLQAKDIKIGQQIRIK
ncbi:MAG: LysM peptidoglycan-binding domain-containing protein [Bacteroidia bacterium]